MRLNGNEVTTAKWDLEPSGLLGPVRLAATEEETVLSCPRAALRKDTPAIEPTSEWFDGFEQPFTHRR